MKSQQQQQQRNDPIRSDAFRVTMFVENCSVNVSNYLKLHLNYASSRTVCECVWLLAAIQVDAHSRRLCCVVRLRFGKVQRRAHDCVYAAGRWAFYAQQTAAASMLHASAAAQEVESESVCKRLPHSECDVRQYDSRCKRATLYVCMYVCVVMHFVCIVRREFVDDIRKLHILCYALGENMHSSWTQSERCNFDRVEPLDAGD